MISLWAWFRVWIFCSLSHFVVGVQHLRLAWVTAWSVFCSLYCLCLYFKLLKKTPPLIWLQVVQWVIAQGALSGPLWFSWWTIQGNTKEHTLTQDIPSIQKEWPCWTFLIQPIPRCCKVNFTFRWNTSESVLVTDQRTKFLLFTNSWCVTRIL